MLKKDKLSRLLLRFIQDFNLESYFESIKKTYNEAIE